MKEILDKFSLLKSLEAVTDILAPYERLKNQERSLFHILTALQVDFDGFAAEKKAETAAKWKATAAPKAAEREIAEVHETGTVLDEDSDVNMADSGIGTAKDDTEAESEVAGPSHQDAP
jgi:hypothetical protein